MSFTILKHVAPVAGFEPIVVIKRHVDSVLGLPIPYTGTNLMVDGLIFELRPVNSKLTVLTVKLSPTYLVLNDGYDPPSSGYQPLALPLS